MIVSTLTRLCIQFNYEFTTNLYVEKEITKKTPNRFVPMQCTKIYEIICLNGFAFCHRVTDYVHPKAYVVNDRRNFVDFEFSTQQLIETRDANYEQNAFKWDEVLICRASCVIQPFKASKSRNDGVNKWPSQVANKNGRAKNAMAISLTAATFL